eukprot:473106-Rhodomonas_salina.2
MADECDGGLPASGGAGSGGETAYTPDHIVGSGSLEMRVRGACAASAGDRQSACSVDDAAGVCILRAMDPNYRPAETPGRFTIQDTEAHDARAACGSGGQLARVCAVCGALSGAGDARGLEVAVEHRGGELQRVERKRHQRDRGARDSGVACDTDGTETAGGSGRRMAGRGGGGGAVPEAGVDGVESGWSAGVACAGGWVRGMAVEREPTGAAAGAAG